MITITPYEKGTEQKLRTIFYNAVHLGCANEYSKAQRNAWASKEYEEKSWADCISNINPFVAKIGGEIVGYANVQEDGYIDHFFVDSRFQAQGVGAVLMKKLFASVEKDTLLYAHVSLTAAPFFKKYGFYSIKKQTLCINDVTLENHIMKYKRPSF